MPSLQDYTVRGKRYRRIVESCRDDRGRLVSEFGIDAKDHKALKRRFLGKRILFTDRSDFADEEIIFGYRGQHRVERAFKDIKDSFHGKHRMPLLGSFY
jgi:transposase